MKTIDKELYIKSKTTGFASPAESYVDKRLDLNELIVNDIKTTFYMRYMGQSTLGVKKGSVLVIDRAEQPKIGDLVVISDTSCLKIREYDNQKNLWGKVCWVLEKK